MTLKVKLLHENATLPKRQNKDDAGYDIYSIEDITIPPGEMKLVRTGISFTVPEGTYGQLAPRSGLSTKGVFVNAGVIDRGYTGEVSVCLFNFHPKNTITLESKSRIAQLILKKIDTPEIVSVDSLQTSDRGSGGFGSTGK
jgi:dUTP pyrophosphatase